MVEDALKTTRNLHRLILSVSVVSLVFSLSLRLPREAETRLKSLTALLEFPFKDYDQFVSNRVNEALPHWLGPVAGSVRTNLASTNYLVFGVEEIANAFSRPFHVGKVQTEQTILAHLSNATLNQLGAFTSALSTTNDVQLLIPEPGELLPKIHQFLHDQGRAGLRVDNLRLTPPNFDFMAQTFVPAGTVLGEIYFELVSVDGPPTPVFGKALPSTVKTLPGTSWQTWLFSQAGAKHIVAHDGFDLKWLPGLGSLPRGFTEKKLGLLISELSDEIKKGSPESQSVSMLGTQVPGLLLVYAVPLTLLVLAYYFLNHIRHLIRLAAETPEDFRKFAWLPLSLGTFWPYELAFSLVVLPALAIAVLATQLQRFGYLGTVPLLVLVGTSALMLTLSALSGRQLARLRKVVLAKPDPPPAGAGPQGALASSSVHKQGQKKRHR